MLALLLRKGIDDSHAAGLEGLGIMSIVSAVLEGSGIMSIVSAVLEGSGYLQAHWKARVG